MNIIKHLEFFNPLNITEEIHIVGVGAIGSNIASQLIRLGVNKIHIWDFDTVDEHNITNQIYTSEDIGKPKTDALKEYLLKINPQCEIVTHKKYTGQNLKGFIYSCVDSIELRHKLATDQQFNMFIKLLVDTRMGLEQGQVYTVEWRKPGAIENYLKTCQFKDSEATATVSACGTTLSVSPTVLITTAYAISSLINYIRSNYTPSQVHFDAFAMKTGTIS